ncbi:hypothetical protein GV829_04705 [Sphingomonas lacunae]|uniref:Uncharacterized protein n=1 Tax=Sphingomonas lacunae TaxID=2698828 RepID=A0A6M4ASZ8_9SPHN|nr:hypothetical protein [Sphingomonas lacunae]QJQ31836.1 hypothetical protein GV829_04705 [Sphingomonas lacunae]
MATIPVEEQPPLAIGTPPNVFDGYAPEPEGPVTISEGPPTFADQHQLLLIDGAVLLLVIVILAIAVWRGRR